jgi:CIC family chloride channel protein
MTAPSQPKEGAISKFEFMIRFPLYVRRLVRRNEVGFIGLAVAAGCIAGLCVAALLTCANFLHYWLFGQRHLSSLVSLDTPAQALVPLAGGLVLGISGILCS